MICELGINTHVLHFVRLADFLQEVRHAKAAHHAPVVEARNGVARHYKVNCVAQVIAV